MFFSWYIKNKQFKRGSGLSGQIAPFLIIILAILLVAAISTINIGRIAIDKTCSANGADAGSLAAASVWAGAFNQLTLINQSMYVFYDINYYTYGQLKATADKYLDEAILYAALTTASAAAATALIVSSSPSICCPHTIPVGLLIAGVLDGLGAVSALQAEMAVSAFNITVQYMVSITDSFYAQQQQNYSDARAYMYEAYINARKTGLSFAFSNSCISEKLSNVQKSVPPQPTQSDLFSAWLAENNWSVGDDGYFRGNYPWNDSLGLVHNVSAGLDLPNIDAYELQHTIGGHDEIIKLLNGLISTSQTISGIFASVAVILAANAFLNVIVFALYAIAFGVKNIPFVGWVIAMALCAAASFIYSALAMEQAWIVTALAGLVGLAGTITLALLGGDNDKAFKDWGPDNTPQPSRSSEADVKEKKAEKNDAAALMIVKISSLTLNSLRGDVWTVVCRVSQQHPSTSVGIVPTAYPTVSSFSESKFSGGDVGDVGPGGALGMNYDPGIVGVIDNEY